MSLSCADDVGGHVQTLIARASARGRLSVHLVRTTRRSIDPTGARVSMSVARLPGHQNGLNSLDCPFLLSVELYNARLLTAQRGFMFPTGHALM
jgi:hypothetical protein